MISERIREILSRYRGEIPGVLTNLSRLLNIERLGGTGHMIILPVDQGFELGPGRSFAENPPAYDPLYHFHFAVDGGLNAYSSGLGFLEEGTAEFAGQVSLILKLNSHDVLHNDLNPIGAQTASVKDALKVGCVGIGYTIYPGSFSRRNSFQRDRSTAMELFDHMIRIYKGETP